MSVASSQSSLVANPPQSSNCLFVQSTIQKQSNTNNQFNYKERKAGNLHIYIAGANECSKLLFNKLPNYFSNCY